MKEELAKILDVCLEEMLAGATVEECLERFPGHRAELEPLLRVATRFEALPKPEPRRAALMSALVEMGAALPERRERRVRSGRAGRRPWDFLRSRPVLLRFAALGLALLIAAWGVNIASAGSGPGDFLYPLKLVREQVTFALTAGPERKAELRLTFADRRLDELVSFVQDEASVDPGLVRALLREAELALDEARPLPKDRFEIILSKIERFNSYQKDVLERLIPRISSGDTTVLHNAISLCERRSAWIQKMWRSSESGTMEERNWGPECRYE